MGKSSWTIAFIVGAAVIGLIAWKIPNGYRSRDFSQDYISGKAVLSGGNPWEVLNVIEPGAGRAYRNPHPPVAVAVSVPFAVLPYTQASLLWLLAELAALVAALEILGKIIGLKSYVLFGLVAAFCLAVWTPVSTELANGQFQCFALLLVMLTWSRVREGHNIEAGGWLGTAIALKMVGVLLIPWVIYRRKWRMLGAAAVSWVCLQAAAGTVVGWEWMRFYYVEIAGGLNKPFLISERNFSVYAIGQRLFLGTADPLGSFYEGSVIFNAPWIAPLLSGVLLLAFVLVVLALMLKFENDDRQIALLIAAGAVILPVAWDYYLLMTFPALALCLRKSELFDSRARLTAIYAIVFSIPAASLIHPFWRQTLGKAGFLLSFLPLLGVGLLIWRLWQVDAEESHLLKPEFINLLPHHLLLATMFLLLLIDAILPVIFGLLLGVIVVATLVGKVLYRKVSSKE